MGDKILLVKCPNCQKTIAWTNENQYRPFCSKRCKLIDLGEWASEGYAIEGDPINPNQEFEE